MKDITGFMEKVLSDLAALAEETMRLGLLCRRLKGLSPQDAALFINALYARGPDEATMPALHALIDPEGIKKTLGKENCAQIYLAAVELDLKKVSRLFTDLPSAESGLSGYESEEDAKMEFITLGERRAMAKGFKKETLLRLISDPDPVVIGNLLNNPRITEKDVVRIASKRPSSARILRLIAGNPAWSKRYGVIKALVLNPFTPPRISIALLEVLLTQDLRLASADRSLHPQVRLAAGELLEEKKGREKGDL